MNRLKEIFPVEKHLLAVVCMAGTKIEQPACGGTVPDGELARESESRPECLCLFYPPTTLSHIFFSISLFFFFIIYLHTGRYQTLLILTVLIVCRTRDTYDASLLTTSLSAVNEK